MTKSQEIGQRIRECRESLGMSQMDLAVKLGFESATAISLIESGQRNLAIEQLIELPSILGQSTEYFIGKSEKQLPEEKTLRDEFAMAALTGLIANPQNMNALKQNAEAAYRYADAMLEARKNKEV